MEKEIVTVIYDRKNEVAKKGRGKVEIRIYLGNGSRKYVTINNCDPFEWKVYQTSKELQTQLCIYKQLVKTMQKNYEELTIENIDNHLGIDKASRIKKQERREEKKKLASRTGFIDFIIDQMAKESIEQGTQKHKYVTLDALKRYGRLSSFADLTPNNIKSFDDFLRKERARSQTTLHNYHKNLKMYTRQAFQLGYISSNPYDNPLCHFKRGTSKERRPLTEDELIMLRNLDDLPEKLEKARDLFIFCAYTGLSYADSQIFDFMNMTEKQNEFYYIDGKRIKTGHTFYTPILPPALEVLKKYHGQVPKLTNQKANDYLHDIEARLKFHKPLTMHVARHSFATLLLANDVPVENVGRMLGHTNIKTTQIYAHILKTTIERHAVAVASKIR